MKNKLVTALLSLVIAFGLWLYVVSVVSPESEQTYYNVPVVLDGSSTLESRGLMLISDKDIRLDLKLSGNRTDLNKLTSGNITVIADLSGITSAGEHTVHYSISYPGSTTSNITPLNQDGQQITVTVAEWAKKDVQVAVEFTGSLPTDYTVDRQNVVLSRNNVTLSGPKEVVDRIHEAYLTVDLAKQTSDFTQSYRLAYRDVTGNPIVDLEHVTASVTDVQATVKVSMIKTLDIVVDVIDGGGLLASDVTCKLEREQLIVSGSAALLQHLNTITFEVDLSKLTSSQTLRFDIELPDGVTNVSGVSQVAVDVTVPEMDVVTIMIQKEDFQCFHVPPGMEVSILKDQLAVIVRGRENRLATLRPENVMVIIDFTNAVEGTGEYTVTVEIVGIDGVGAVGDYSVMATVTKQPNA